jgi:uroporphyrinogen-III decarboxylase
VERVRNIKRYKEFVLLHSCGNTKDIIDIFIKAGICCYQSLQTNAGMNIEELTTTYRDKMRFWGGVGVESLIDGTQQEVREQVGKSLEIAKKGHPFILGPSHSIAFGVQYDNFMAMLDEYEKNKYI